MKKFVLWLIKVFRLDIQTIKYITKVETKKVYVRKSDIYEHDLIVDGNLIIRGNLDVKGEISCYNIKEEKL